MRDLIQCREAIDEIDNKIIELLEQRQSVASDVAIYKLAHNQSIVDKRREAEKISTLMQKAVERSISPSMIKEVYEKIMAHTVAYEQSYIVDALNNKDIKRNTSVAYLGTKGTYSHLASHKFFDHYQGRLQELSCDNFAQIVNAVENNQCEYGVLPIENSNSGSINEAVDTMQNMQASIVGEIFISIDHSILALEPLNTLVEDNSNYLHKIKTIYSHPQPIAQCSNFIKDNLAHAHIIYTNSSSDAMSKIKELNDNTAVAIGSMHAARFYNLNPIINNIANAKSNYTRFIVIANNPIKVPHTMKAKTTLLFSTKKYTPGSLLNVLNEFKKHDINLTKLYSRPLEGVNRNGWEEIFFADVEANLDTPIMQEILAKIKEHSTNLKVLGCYLSKENN